MGFWDTNTITAANMNRLGPLVDGVVGTAGQYQDLYEAMSNPAGPLWRRVFVVPGATINGNVSVSSYNGGCIIGIGFPSVVGTGTIAITDCFYWQFNNLFFSGASGNQISILGTSQANLIQNCRINNAGGVAIYINGSWNKVLDCTLTNSASHGIEITATPAYNIWINGCRIRDSGGWGILDASGKIIASDNHVMTNTAGQISSASAYLSNNQTS